MEWLLHGPLARPRARVLGGFLGEVEVAEQANQGSEDASPLFAEDLFDQRSTTGRTSTVPPSRAAGIREAGDASADASACCNQAQFPNTPNNGGPIPGRGGGRVGAVAVSPFIRPGTVSSHPYNHFSTLRTVETLFGLPFLGYAGSPDPGTFGADVFSR
jgi:hypothetical protein